MSRTLTISDTLFERLQDAAQAQGLESVEQLLEQWQSRGDDLRERQETVREIDALREELFSRYGEMPDSADLMRDDRAR